MSRLRLLLSTWLQGLWSRPNDPSSAVPCMFATNPMLLVLETHARAMRGMYSSPSISSKGKTTCCCISRCLFRTIPLFVLISFALDADMNIFCANGNSQSTTCLLPREGHAFPDAVASVAATLNIRRNHHSRPTLAERRSCSHLPPLQLSSKKRSISVTSEHVPYGDDVYSRHVSPTPLAKRKKEPLVQQQLGCRPFEDRVKTARCLEWQESQQPLVHETALPGDRVTSPAPNALTDSKGLLSPIKLGPQLTTDGISTRTTTSHHIPSVLKYEYYPPTNPSDGQGLSTTLYKTGPRRKLSYGEALSHPQPRSLHKSTGSAELRSEAGWCTANGSDRSWFNDESSIPAIKPWYSEPPRAKPRLWLDLAEDGERIEEAVSILSLRENPFGHDVRY